MTSTLVEDGLLRFIPAVALLTAVGIGTALAVLRRPLPQRLVTTLSCLSAFASLVLSAVAFTRLVFRPEGEEGAAVLVDTLYTWVGAGVGTSAFSADLAFRFDALTAILCLVVCAVSLLIHIYSVGYFARDRREDGGAPRYFCYLGLLTASMLVLVLADNLLLLFLGWQGVAVGAYLLTSFWYGEAAHPEAASRVFVAERLSDVGFVAGTLLLFWALSEARTPAVSFRGIEAGFGAIADATLATPEWLGLGDIGLATVLGLCFLIAAAGKSAQLPLYLWPATASVAPAPAGALLAGATQVAAGVYLLARLSFVFEASATAAAALAWVGGATAFVAALFACVQNDVRRVLAWAAIAQAGMMFVAAGAGAFGLAIFGLTTNAVVIAVLFLGTGTVVVALDGECDLRKMGGLRPRLERSWWVMGVGALALAGVPPLSVFFSRGQVHDAILHSDRIPASGALQALTLVTGVLIAFHAGRLFLRIFHGEVGVRRRRAEIHPAGNLMMWPLYVLSAFAVIGGMLGVPQFFGDMMEIQNSDSLGNFLATAIPPAGSPSAEPAPGGTRLPAAIGASALGLLGAYAMYLARPAVAEWLGRSFAHRWVSEGFFLPSAYAALFGPGLTWFSERVLDQGLAPGQAERRLVEGSAARVREFAVRGLRLVQSGVVQVQLIVAVLGALFVLLYFVGWL